MREQRQGEEELIKKMRNKNDITVNTKYYTRHSPRKQRGFPPQTRREYFPPTHGQSQEEAPKNSPHQFDKKNEKITKNLE